MQPIFDTVLFSEYASEDISGKYSLCGLLPGDVQVERFPFRFVFALYMMRSSGLPGEESIQVDVLQNDERIYRAIATVERKKSDEVGVLLLPRIFAQFVSEGTLSVKVELNRSAPQEVARKLIRLRASSDSSAK